MGQSLKEKEILHGNKPVMGYEAYVANPNRAAVGRFLNSKYCSFRLSRYKVMKENLIPIQPFAHIRKRKPPIENVKYNISVNATVYSQAIGMAVMQVLKRHGIFLPAIGG